MRTEFGATRTSCACKICVRNCHYLPGFLIPADLDRLIPDGADPFEWAEIHLDASPGAIVMNSSTGKVLRIPTLVPRTHGKGSMACHWFDSNDRCTVHENSPFGCSMFNACDTSNPERDQKLSMRGLVEVAKSHSLDPPGLYSMIWRYLHDHGFRSKSPEEKREAMRASEIRDIKPL